MDIRRDRRTPRAYDLVVLDARITSHYRTDVFVRPPYDATGRRTTMTVVGQPVVTYTYHNADRLTQLTQGASTVSLAYDLGGRRTSLTLPDGVVTTFTYDLASRLTGLTYTLGASALGTLTYGYDAAGQRTQVGGSWARTPFPQAITTASYNGGNQQLGLGGSTMTYDLNGNLTTRTDGSDTTTYTWDTRNRLTGLASPTTTASFGYDALGRRWTKTINGARTDFLYDGLNPVQEGVLPATSTATLLTGLGIDEYFTRTDATGTATLLPDALGSTLALTDPAGAVTTEYTYEPFGATTVTGTPSPNPFQYTGRESDGTGLSYYRARYYHPALQRFVSEDPIGFAGGDVNLYAYVFNVPTASIDPLGERFGWIPRGAPAPGQRYIPPTRPMRPTPNPSLRPGPGEPPLPPNPLEPHPYGGDPHPWPGFPPCTDGICPGGIVPPGRPGGPGSPGGPAPGGGRKDPPPPPPLPPPCDPFYQMAGLCPPDET